MFIVLQLRDVLTWYSEDFKDPMVVDPPEWFQSFILCEAVVQLPFFPVASYAFLKGQFDLTGSRTSCFNYDLYVHPNPNVVIKTNDRFHLNFNEHSETAGRHIIECIK